MNQAQNSFEKSDRILIAGGTGFIGKRLAARCLNDTPYVVSLGLRAPADASLLPVGLESIEADISDKAQLQSVLNGRPFDYVFNLGGYIDHTPYFKGGRRLIDSHLIGLMNLLDCLDKNSLKGFVQIGSSDEYGDVIAPQKETLRESPISPYSFAKTAASHFIQMLHATEAFPGVVLRLFLVYGPGQDEGRFLPQIIKAFLKGEAVETTEGMQLRDFCYVDDIVNGMVVAALTPKARGRIINLASGKPVAIRDMVEKVKELVGKGNAVFGARSYRENENMQLYADIGVAEELLNWSPAVALEEGLKRTIKHYQGAGKKL